MSDELLSAYLDGELGPDERAGVERWLAEDEDARRGLEELRTLGEGLRSLPRYELGPAFRDRVMREIERVVGPDAPGGRAPGATISPASSIAGGSGAWRSALAAVGALAAVLLVVLLLPALQRSPPIAEAPPAVVQPPVVKTPGPSTPTGLRDDEQQIERAMAGTFRDAADRFAKETRPVAAPSEPMAPALPGGGAALPALGREKKDEDRLLVVRVDLDADQYRRRAWTGYFDRSEAVVRSRKKALRSTATAKLDAVRHAGNGVGGAHKPGGELEEADVIAEERWLVEGTSAQIESLVAAINAAGGAQPAVRLDWAADNRGGGAVALPKSADGIAAFGAKSGEEARQALESLADSTPPSDLQYDAEKRLHVLFVISPQAKQPATASDAAIDADVKAKAATEEAQGSETGSVP